MTAEHDAAMSLAAEAELLSLAGREEAAREQLERAAEHEERAADDASEDRPRTRGILRISAVSLWLQAGHPTRAVTLASRYLSDPLEPTFARELDEVRLTCERAALAAASLPSVSADFVARAREQEEKFVRHELPSGSIAAWRPAA
jgi:hypothetical protein